MRLGSSAIRSVSAWRCIVAVSMIVLGACTKYEARPIDPQRSLSEFSSRRLDSPAVRDDVERLLPRAATTWPPQEWDRAELLAVALVSNRKLDVARAQVQAAVAREISAGETKNPDLTLQSEYARHDPHPWLYGVSLDFLVRPAESRRLDVEFSRLDASNARWQLLDQVWTVRHALITALSDCEAARHKEDLLQQLVSAQQTLAATVAKRVAAGEDNASELFVAQQAAMDITQQQADARLARATAEAALSAALGLPPSALEQAVIAWPDWGHPPASGKDELLRAREQALLSRSDLATSIGEYAQSENKLQQAIRRQYPQFQLSPGYYWDHGVAKFPFDVGFTLPLFNHSQGEIAEANAAREVAGQRMLATQAEIYGQISAAENAEQIARDGVVAVTQQLDVVRQQQRHAHFALRLGAMDAGENIGAEILTLRAELELVQVQAQLQTARNATEDALRIPLSGPELELSSSFAITAAEASR